VDDNGCLLRRLSDLDQGFDRSADDLFSGAKVSQEQESPVDVDNAERWGGLSDQPCLVGDCDRLLKVHGVFEPHRGGR